tara:strand:- start:13938 stop:14210 length:273 start_codon:yes stop_codon:yes gene_type:complete
MTNKITQEYIDYLVDKTEKMEKRFNQLLIENAELRQSNMLLRQQLDQKDERVFIANKCRSRNNHVDGYQSAEDIRMDIIARNGGDGEHYE